MIVLNSLNEKGAGFLHDTNSVKLILKNSVTSTGLDTKDNIANYILDFIDRNNILIYASLTSELFKCNIFLRLDYLCQKLLRKFYQQVRIVKPSK